MNGRNFRIKGWYLWLFLKILNSNWSHPSCKNFKHPYKDRVNIYAKLEYLNPGGSVKTA